MKVDDYMNKKGFTLIELLAVIVILSLLALLAGNAITNIVKDSREELYNTQIKLIEAATESWASDNLDLLPDVGSCKYMKLSYLKDYGIIDKNITNPKTNKSFSNELLIKITTEENKLGLNNTIYEIDTKDIEGCESIYGTCTFISDVDNNKVISVGDKYRCKVKDDMEFGYEDGYYFYVLSKESDGSFNLIMEKNIHYDTSSDAGIVADDINNKGAVEWYKDSEDASFGPVTAMDYLHNATKGWNNVSNITMDYWDEGYTSFRIKTVDNVTSIIKYSNIIVKEYTDLKARLPEQYEVYLAGCDGSGSSSCSIWVSNYLKNGGVNGYWTLSSSTDSKAYRVRYNNASGQAAVNTQWGVRPVINVKF